MADVLSPLVDPTALSSGDNTVVTVPSSHTYTFVLLRVENPTAGSITFRIGKGGVADANLIVGDTTLDAGEHFDDSDRHVFTTGQVLHINASGAGLTVSASGLDQS